MKRRDDQQFVLTFYPSTHGYAFVLFEGPEAPFDWGMREIRGREKNRESKNALATLIERYHPEALVIEDTTERRSRRATRIKRLHSMLRHVAEGTGVEVSAYSRADMRATFAPVGALRKQEIAEAIAVIIPAFAHHLPRKRKIWTAEDPRQSLFDAAALGLTYYAHRGSVTLARE